MVEARAQRRLSAILAADVVGYSRMMGDDETGTLGRLKSLRAEAVDPKIEEHGGRIVKLMGDGMLIEFASAIDAVGCAVAIQESMAAWNEAQPSASPVTLRIGVNLGDVLVEDGDIFGDGVNLAARLEGLAEPGSVCISEDVFRMVHRKVDLDFIDIGRKSVKNIAEPVQAYLIRSTAEASTAAAISTGLASSQDAIAQRPAVAVLPFENMSGDPEQDYFSDGLAEDLITALSHWRSFPVVARNSSFSYKGQSLPVQRIAQELGARYILEGSVRKAGQRLRISAKLIDADSGHNVWAERFDRQMEDIFDVQDEITNRIAATIVPELEHFEHRHSAVKRTEDLSAWDYYLRGMETFHDETCAGTETSMEMFKEAVALDPNYSDAWARLGWCYAKRVMFDCSDDREGCIKLGFEATRKAVALDDGSALAHISLGTVHIWAEETELGLAEALTALELNPNFAHAAMAAGNRLDLVGKTEEGIAQMERALVLNPRDPIRWRYMAYLSRAYISHGEYERAADWAHKAVMLRPDHPEPLYRYAITLGHLDRVEEARAALEQCNAADASYVAKRANWRPYPDQARSDHFLDGLKRHGLLP